ncbi:MAG: hypothetical protein MRERV_34c016 [Mycoplasmataceae bacterium RV_VA103A]|nr:MAG: hypothetical protein MRERV_34c016 [Mycoplasmataceae bacterium RV_VA103A]
MLKNDNMKRICTICSTPFTGHHLSKTCSPQCSQKLKKINNREYQLKYQRELRKKTSKQRPPKIVSCWRCQKTFNWEYSPNTKNYLERNRWDYWTEKEEGKYICDACLMAFYYFEKSELLSLKKSKRNTLKGYIGYHQNKFILKDTFNCDKDYWCYECGLSGKGNCGKKITVWNIVDPLKGVPCLLKEFVG